MSFFLNEKGYPYYPKKLSHQQGLAYRHISNSVVQSQTWNPYYAKDIDSEKIRLLPPNFPLNYALYYLKIDSYKAARQLFMLYHQLCTQEVMITNYSNQGQSYNIDLNLSLITSLNNGIVCPLQ